jgi:hypothetical protein
MMNEKVSRYYPAFAWWDWEKPQKPVRCPSQDLSQAPPEGKSKLLLPEPKHLVSLYQKVQIYQHLYHTGSLGPYKPPENIPSMTKVMAKFPVQISTHRLINTNTFPLIFSAPHSRCQIYYLNKEYSTFHSYASQLFINLYWPCITQFCFSGLFNDAVNSCIIWYRIRQWYIWIWKGLQKR